MSREKFLIIRRDNIGDLICTLPLIRSIRQQRPDARIVVLANRYNAPVLHGNPDIDAVFTYQKGKHREEGEGILGTLSSRLQMIWRLRQENFDWILLPGGFQSSAERMARWIGAPNIVRIEPSDHTPGQHEVELTCRLLPKVGLAYQTPSASIFPRRQDTDALQALLNSPGKLVAIHISARKISQRWSAENFIELIKKLLALSPDISVLLLWAPGNERDPKHPGDDGKAQTIIDATLGLSVIPYKTQGLEFLISALSLADSVICCDGGAMHVAAGLNKPIVCLFGDSEANRWHPWGVAYRLLQLPSQHVDSIEVSSVVDAWLQLTGEDGCLGILQR